MGLLAKPQGREHLVMTKVSLAVSQKKKKGNKEGGGELVGFPIYWTQPSPLLSISPRTLKQLSPRDNSMHLHLQHAKHFSNTTASSCAPLCKKKKKKEWVILGLQSEEDVVSGS